MHSHAALLLLLVVAGCGDSAHGQVAASAPAASTDETPVLPPSAMHDASAVVGPNPNVELDAEANVDPNWPPPHMLHFAGYGFDRILSDTHVNQKQAFAQTVRSEALRGAREPGGDVVSLGRCLNCLPGFAVDESTLYFLRVDTVVQFDIATWMETRTNVPVNHSGDGAIAIDEKYVYSAQPGCPLVGRYSKPELAGDVTTLPPVQIVNGGNMVLRVRRDGGVLCGSPNGIAAIDTWGQPGRLLPGEVLGLRGMDSSGDWVYWVEWDDDPYVGVVKWSGDEPAQKYPLERGGDLAACLVPDTQLLVIAAGRSLDVFDGQKRALVASLDLNGRPHSVDCQDDAVYLAVEGVRERGPQYTLADEKAAWIARVPNEVIVGK